MFGSTFGMSAALLLASPISVDAPENAPAADVAAVEAAKLRGEQIYLHDQAAWHGTDALAAEIDLSKQKELRGYVTEELENGRIGLIFYAELDGANYEFARYEVDGSTVTGGGRHDDPKQHPLSPLLERKIAARNVAIEEAVARKITLCADARPNLVVLGPDQNDQIAVYILTPVVNNGRFPLGGHYRVDIDGDNTVLSGRTFTNTCIDGPMVPKTNPLRPVIQFYTHVLDPHPTEIHFLAAHYMEMSLSIAADNNIWMLNWPEPDEDAEAGGAE